MSTEERERSPARNDSSSYREREPVAVTPRTPKTPMTPKTPLGPTATAPTYFSSDSFIDGLSDVPPCDWKYTKLELVERSPSRKYPSELRQMSYEEEIQKRAKGVIYLFKCCRQLRLSRSVAMTASYYFHRFYMRRDLISHHYFEIAAASLFIACKAEECRRRLADVVKVCAKAALQNSVHEPIDEDSKVYWKWKDLLISLEELILETLCFEVTPENPYKTILRALRLEEDIVRDTVWLRAAKDLFITCTNLCELICRVPLVLLHDTNGIAALAVVMSSLRDEVKVPENFLRHELRTDIDATWRCYEDLVELSKPLSTLDVYFQVLPHIPRLTREQFLAAVE